MNNSSKLALSLAPVVYLIAALTFNIYIFGDNGISGSIQVIILSAAAVAAAIALAQGVTWDSLQEGVKHNISTSAVAILILLMVGALTGTWLVSGIVPIMIYYGLQILSPEIFLPASVIICALVSIATGSSWTTAATIGIALMGIGEALGMNLGIVAGAIISGSYFGDKMSPLSDTTNLASTVAGVPLFRHIRYMSYTTGPSILICLLMFVGIGLTLEISDQALEVEKVSRVLTQYFNLNPLLLIAPAAVIFMVVKRVPALPAIFVGVLLGAILALVFQPGLLREVGIAALGDEQGSVVYAGLSQTLFGEVTINTGNPNLDGLLSSGGMSGMLNTIWLIISAMAFGGIMEAGGMLRTITNAIMTKVRSARSLVASTAGTCLLVNASASDQYLSVVITGKMFPQSYRELGLAPQNLSRTLEDSGTVTSVLVPWNTCGAYHAGVLGVATLSYAPYCFFNIISPFMTVLFAWAGIKIARLVLTQEARATQR